MNLKKFIQFKITKKSKKRFKNLNLIKAVLLNSLNNSYYLTIKIKQNNIFCLLSEIIKNKTILKLSSGNLKINISKKTLKYNSKIIIPYFINLIPKSVLSQIFLIKLISPSFLKRKIFLQISRYLKKNQRFFFFIDGKKSFNGCRVPKYKRKKRHKFRILKK